MAPGYIPTNITQHVRERPGRVLEFRPEAVDITLLSRRGKAIWRQLRRSPEEPVLWEGQDQMGRPVEKGTYVLRILYPDVPPVYVPFLVM